MSRNNCYRGSFLFLFPFISALVFEAQVGISILIWVLQTRAVNALLREGFVYEWVEFMWQGQGQSHQRKESVQGVSDPVRNIKGPSTNVFETLQTKIYIHIKSVSEIFMCLALFMISVKPMSISSVNAHGHVTNFKKSSDYHETPPCGFNFEPISRADILKCACV